MTERDAPHYELGPVLDFMRQLWALNHAIERLSKRTEAVLGVTAQQRILLRIVGKYPGITATQLQDLLHLDRATLSRSLKRLEGRGLVVREKQSSDARRVALGLSAAGRKLDVPTPGTIESAVEELFKVTSDFERAAFQEVMQRASTAMEIELGRRARAALRPRERANQARAAQRGARNGNPSMQ